MMVMMVVVVLAAAIVPDSCAPSAPAIAKSFLPNTLRSRLPSAVVILMPLLPKACGCKVSPGPG